MNWKKIIPLTIAALTVLGSLAGASYKLVDSNSMQTTKIKEHERRINENEKRYDKINDELKDINKSLGLIKGALGIQR